MEKTYHILKIGDGKTNKDNNNTTNRCYYFLEKNCFIKYFCYNEHRRVQMEKTIELNQKHNIIPVKCGLGDKEETLFLNENYNPKNIGGAYIADENIKNGETAYIIPLDKYIKENNLDVGLIKIDVEGFEQNVLNGAYETIKKCRPTLLISIYHKPDDFFEIAPMIKQWNLGYKLKYVPLYTYNDFLVETMIIAEPV